MVVEAFNCCWDICEIDWNYWCLTRFSIQLGFKLGFQIKIIIYQNILSNCLHLKRQFNLQFIKASFRCFREDPGPKMTKTNSMHCTFPAQKNQELGLRFPATTAAAEGWSRSAVVNSSGWWFWRFWCWKEKWNSHSTWGDDSNWLTPPTTPLPGLVHAAEVVLSIQHFKWPREGRGPWLEKTCEIPK